MDFLQFAHNPGLGFGVGATLFGKVFEGGFQVGFVAPVGFQGSLTGPVTLGDWHWPVMA